MSHFFGGVGSRETPPHILEVMTRISSYLVRKGMVLLSGGADGADSAFELGVDKVNPNNKNIFIPWRGFSKRWPNQRGVYLIEDPDVVAKAQDIASQIHPAWDRLGRGPRGLHTRNVYQVLGKDLKTPIRFMICYAVLDKKGEPKGGTRTAIKIAEMFNIKVYNLYKPEDLKKIEEILAQENT